jgi:hypothetical protein
MSKEHEGNVGEEIGYKMPPQKRRIAGKLKRKRRLSRGRMRLKTVKRDSSSDGIVPPDSSVEVLIGK